MNESNPYSAPSADVVPEYVGRADYGGWRRLPYFLSTLVLFAIYFGVLLGNLCFIHTAPRNERIFREARRRERGLLIANERNDNVVSWKIITLPNGLRPTFPASCVATLGNSYGYCTARRALLARKSNCNGVPYE